MKPPANKKIPASPKTDVDSSLSGRGTNRKRAGVKAPTPQETEPPIMAMTSAIEWEKWLEKNHAKSSGIWLRFFKKNSGINTVTYAEALDGALCHGWIDGQVKKHDAASYLQKFTPRRPKSLWSRINTQHVERLHKAGKMKPAGHAAVEAAKADGRWQAAYDSHRNMTIPADFLAELSRDKKAKAFFDTLNKTNLYSIAWRLQTAVKPETRQRRMSAILEKLARGEKYHA